MLAALLAMDKASGPIGDQLWAWAIILAGPLNPRLWETVPVLATIALLLSPAILAHPVRPNLLTAAATIISLAIWFFSGAIALAVHIGP